MTGSVISEMPLYISQGRPTELTMLEVCVTGLLYEDEYYSTALRNFGWKLTANVWFEQ